MDPQNHRLFPTFLALTALALAGCSGGGEGSPASGLPGGTFARLELETAYPEPFSFLNSVRELSDGTIMAADPLSQVLLHIDLLAGTADTLGRVGEGPQEYKQPDQVFPLPGDSTLLVDIGKMQLTAVGPDGVMGDGKRMASASEGGRFEVILPRYLDARGRIYMTGSRGMDSGPPDSTLILRHDRTTETSDTMGWIWRPEPIVTRSGSGVRMISTQMEGRDDWAVGPDGQFAIVRVSDYSVQWRYPDGRVVTGPPNPVEARSISDEDKLAYLEDRSSAGLMMMVSQSSSGAMDMTMSRGGGGMRLGDDEPNLLDYQWAEVFPPFRPDRAQVAPTGELWVERWLPPNRNPQMDVFDGEGSKLGTVDLPEERDLLGFGSTAEGDPAVYLVRTDEFDLKWLERYRLVR
jgi:hypothetical protein